MTPSAELLARTQGDEAELVLYTFEEDDAWELGSLIVERARKRGHPIAVDVRRPTGQILFHAALPGAMLDNDEWIRRKVNTVFRFSKSSFSVAISLALAGTTIAEKSFVDPKDYASAGGSFPIRLHGVGIVAAVSVSGLPQEDDHALVVECLREFKKRKQK